MPTVYALIAPKQQWEDANGNPLSGYKLFVYTAGTTTKETTYQDAAGTTPNSNPIVLNALGQCTAGLYTTTGLKKLVMAPPTDTDPPSSPLWTFDNIRAPNDISTTLDQWELGTTPTYINSTQFSVVGDQRNTYQVGRRIQAAVTAGTVFGRISASAFASVTTVTVVLDSGALDSGLSAVSYGLISPTNTSAPLMDDSLPRIMNASDKTKLIREDASAIATGTTRVRSMPNYDVRLGNITPGIGPISYSGRTIPTGWLDSNQAPVSRVTYAGLFEVVVPLIGMFTVTIASPGVFTLNSHGFAAGEPVYLTTTGALPTGLSANVIYYIASAGLTTNTFQLSSVPGGASINTSGSQSGTHSIRFCPYGLGDGSTTFGLPKSAGRYMLGDGSGSFVENVTNASINTGTDAVTVQSNTDAWITGMLITWTVSGTPPTTSPANLLDNNDTVYIVRIDSTTVKFATTLANAQNGTVIDITAAGSGTFTMTYALTPRLMGYSGGEEQHLQYITEMPSHQHDTNIDNPGGSPVTSAAGSATPGSNILTAAAGGSVPMNIRTPYTVTKMIISY